MASATTKGEENYTREKKNRWLWKYCASSSEEEGKKESKGNFLIATYYFPSSECGREADDRRREKKKKIWGEWIAQLDNTFCVKEHMYEEEKNSLSGWIIAVNNEILFIY